MPRSRPADVASCIHGENLRNIPEAGQIDYAPKGGPAKTAYACTPDRRDRCATTLTDARLVQDMRADEVPADMAAMLRSLDAYRRLAVPPVDEQSD